ncbi:hypothetical protein Tco_1080124 [Tanacetum coccineum]|uniref:Uncharacterized protein n=1 Tax=Tanacetum coccineum TaxID=301880 RepID=A0ABQ5HUP1_9ASTR
MVKSWLVQDQTVLGKDYSNLLIADSLLKTIWFINAPCYGNEALASPKANGVWIAKDVKETLRSDQDLSECLNTSSMKFKESTPKKHEVKQVQQSCLGEDCWELYIPDLVPNSMAGSEDDIPPPPPPPSQTPTQQTPHTVSTIKLPILKKGEYDIWAMKMEHYLAHTDYPIWEVIQRGNGPVSVSTDTNGLIKVLPPKTAKEILARERERKARTTLLMALPEDHC